MANEKQAFNGNIAASSDDPFSVENVLQKGMNGLSLKDFMKLTGLTKEVGKLPGVNQ